MWIVVGVIVLAVAGAGVWFVTTRSETGLPSPAVPLASPVAIPLEKEESGGVVSAPREFQQIKGAHFVSSSPTHGAELTAPPTTVTVTFDFTLGAGSAIAVERDGVDVTTGPTTIAPNKLSMSVPVNAPAGSYVASYTGCWPDGSCHSGAFGFTVK